MDRCPKCESSKIIHDVMVCDFGDYNFQLNARVAVQRNPQAWFDKGQVTGKLRATICSECGFTEMFVSDPEKLYMAYLAAQQNKPADSEA
jgi:predicted nucleic-acid-binding Zn-ribbon protein